MIHSTPAHSVNRRVFASSRAYSHDRDGLPAADYRKIQEYHKEYRSGRSTHSVLLTHLLFSKLMNTRPVSNVHCSDLVVGGCRVFYRIDREGPQTAVLTHEAEAGHRPGLISIASLLGATLIGMRVGHRAALLREDGSIGRLSVTGAS